MNYETWLQSDLKKPMQVQTLHGVFFSADNAANLIGVEVYDNGAAASLSGTVIGYAIRADGGTLTITGTLSGNKASIILPTSAYVLEGPLDIVIKVVSGSVRTTVGACRGYVVRATTDTIIDPGHVIPSLEELLAQIDACEQATDAANTAASNANSKATAANTAATNANTAATAANTAAGTANTAAANADAKAALANTAAGKIDNMTVAATTGNPGTNAQAVISEVSGHKHIAFTIPRGDTGATGDKGDTGDTGAAATITSTVTTYQNSTSGNTVPTGTWETTQPTTPQGQYLWTRTVLTWNNGQTTTLYSVSRQGIDGEGSVQSVNSISPDANGNVVLPVDATPTNGSSNPVSSDGVFDALAGKQDTLTFDSAPTSGSANPVTSGGVYTGLDGKVNKSGDTMTGRLIVKMDDAAVWLKKAGSTDEFTAAFRQQYIGSANRTLIQQRTDGSAATESYYFPIPDPTPSYMSYGILTSKNPVTIAQGGTGATTANAALTNLGIGALFSGGTVYSTMSALITAIQARANNDKMIYAVSADIIKTLTNSTSTLPGIAVILKASASNAYYFAFNRDGAGYGNINYSSGTASIIEPLVGNFYKPGDTFVSTSQDNILAGLLTSASTSLQFTLYTPKSLDRISTISVTSFIGGARIIEGGYLGSGKAASPWAGGWNFQWVGASGLTISAYKTSSNSILIKIDSSTEFTVGNTTTVATNNTPVNIGAKFSLTFA